MIKELHQNYKTTGAASAAPSIKPMEKTAMLYEIKEPTVLLPLFSGCKGMLLRACLEGTMGRLYADSVTAPKSALAVLGDFCFFAGLPDKRLLDTSALSQKNSMILVPQTPEWGTLIEEVLHGKINKTVRFATKKEASAFHTDALRQIVNTLPTDYRLRMIDEELFGYCAENDWCHDFVSNYKNYAQYREMGLGVMVFQQNEALAGASSYASFCGGIEIQIDTKEAYRRHGLASVCGAALILSCLERGLYPNWDAQNPSSLALAKKLGYHFDFSYPVYETTVPLRLH